MKKRYFTLFATAAIALSGAAATGDPEQGGTYENNIMTQEQFDEFLIIDANDDGSTWTYDEDNAEGRVRYNTDKTTPKDDWLITPAIHLESGKEYKITIDMRVRNKEEVFELKYGTERTAAGMTEEIIGPTTLVNSDGIRMIEFLTVETTGDYYIGIHAMSPADRSYIYFQYLGISSPVDVKAPGMVTDMKITPDIDGAGNAVVSFHTPAVTVGGDPLTEITYIELFRDKERIQTFTDPGIDVDFSWTDEFDDYAEYGDRDPMGNHSWSVLVYNNSGSGKRVTADGFIGINVPAPPETVNAVETANEGEVCITWTEASSDIAGNAIRPEKCTYNIYEISSGKPVEIVTGVTGLTYTYQAIENGNPQDMLKFAVTTTNEGGTSDYSNGSMLIAVGSPYTLPFAESFADGHLGHVFGIFYTSGNPTVYSMKDEGDITSQDGDNGFLAFGSEEAGSGYIRTGKITLDIADPELRFWVLNNGDNDNRNMMGVSVFDSDEIFDHYSATISDLAESRQWGEAVVDLSNWTGKTVSLGFNCALINYQWIMLDNISIAAARPKDGLENVGNDAEASITSGEGYIEVCATDTVVDVFTVDGRRVFSGHCEGSLHVDLARGLYVVRTANVSRRVVVR